MNLLIRKAILFALFTIIVYLSLFALLFYIRTNEAPIIFRTSQGNTYRGGHTFVSFNQFNPKEKYDIIVLGSSHAYRGYDPAIFKEHNLNLFNFGTNSQINIVSLFIAKEYIRKENCRIVIIDIFDPVFRRKSLESVSDYIQNTKSTRKVFEIGLVENDIRTINMITMRMFNHFNGIFNPDTAGIVNGYVPYLTKLKSTDKRTERYYRADEKAFIHFEKLIQYLHDEGIKIIVTEHPLPALFSIPKADHAELVDKINPILKKYDIPFYDHLYDSSMADIQYYSNTNHLSVIGVEKYNNILLKELENDGRLTR